MQKCSVFYHKIITKKTLFIVRCELKTNTKTNTFSCKIYYTLYALKCFRQFNLLQENGTKIFGPSSLKIYLLIPAFSTRVFVPIYILLKKKDIFHEYITYLIAFTLITDSPFCAQAFQKTSASICKSL